MQWSKTLDRKALSVFFAFMMIFPVLPTYTRAHWIVGVSIAEMPRYSVGDKWKFSLEDKAGEHEIGKFGTLTYEIIGDSVEYNYLGIDNLCYEGNITGGGTMRGESTTGNWTSNSKFYDRKSDLSEVKEITTNEVTLIVGGWEIPTTEIIETTYDPPLESHKGFPLTVGKNWSATTTETVTTKSTVDGRVYQETETTTYTKNYVVLRTELTIVSAGEFKTFVIKAADPDGSYSEYYYSPEAGYYAKVMAYDRMERLASTLELLEFSYAMRAPNIWVLSPEHKTYTTSSVSLNFTVDEPISWIGYSQDGREMLKIAGNTTLAGMSDGVHSLIVYAMNTAGNIGASDTIYFSIDTMPSGFSTLIIIDVFFWITVLAVICGTGYFLYKKKGRQQQRANIRHRRLT